jgi:hypothetical protein
MSRRNIRAVLAGTLVFLGGMVAFFFSWAIADSAKSIPLGKTAFGIVSFPIFYVAPIHFTETYFWELAILNYLGWAALAAWLMRLWKSD